MRILNIDGRYFVRPFQKMGHEVLTIGPFAQSDIKLTQTISLNTLLKILKQQNFTPDLIVWADICRPPSVLGIENFPAITVGYSIDQYCNPWHGPYRAAFDLMLVAQKDYLPMFVDNQLGGEYEWAPLFCDSEKDIDSNIKRDIPVGFVGTVEGSINKQRKLFLQTFKKQHPLIVTQGEYVPVYNRCQIVLNQSAVGELNFRIFEAMACGAVMLTEETENGLSELFEYNEEILVYPHRDAMQAANKAKTSLSNQRMLQTIAKNGRHKVLTHHSSSARAKHIIEKAHEFILKGKTWRQENRILVNKYVANALTMLAIDESLPISKELREFYIEIGKKILMGCDQQIES